MENVDVLLICPPRFFGKDFTKLGERACYLSTPMGLFGIGDLLEKEGFSVKILNIPLELYIDNHWSLTRFLERVHAKIYAISLHWVFSSYGAIETARICKRINPSATVILGGFTASYFDLEIMRKFPFVDYVVRGDGELPIMELSKKIREGTSRGPIPNLTYRKDNEIIRTPTSYVAASIDHMSFARLELLEHWKEYLTTMKQVMGLPFSVAVARGCPFNCPFCGGGQKAGEITSGRSTVALRSIEKVVEDINALIEIADVKSVYFGHGAYPQNISYWKKLFRIIQKEKISIGADLEIWRLPVDRNFVTEFSKTFDHSTSSLSFVTYPKRVRSRLEPLTDSYFNYDENAFKGLLNEATVSDIPLRLWFTVGNPFETVKDTFENLEAITKIFSSRKEKRRNIAFFNLPVTVNPASPAFEKPRSFGISLEPSTFLDFYKIFRDVRFILGEVNNVVNYRTEFLSKRAIKFWNTILTATAIPFFLTNTH